MNKIKREQFESILSENGNPAEAFAEWILQMKADGVSQREIYDAFEAFRSFLRDERRDSDEDLIMETMDCIVGFCSRDQRFFGPPTSDFP